MMGSRGCLKRAGFENRQRRLRVVRGKHQLRVAYRNPVIFFASPFVCTEYKIMENAIGALYLHRPDLNFQQRSSLNYFIGLPVNLSGISPCW